MHTPQCSAVQSVCLSHCTSVSPCRVGLVAAISSNILIVCILIELIKMQILALDHDQPSRPRAREHAARQLQTRESVQIACDFFLSVVCVSAWKSAKMQVEQRRPNTFSSLLLPCLVLADQQSTKVFFISISISFASFTFSSCTKKSTKDSLI